MGTEKIELTFKTLNDQGFISAMRGLVNHKFDAMTTAYKLKKIIDKVDSESKKAGELWSQEYSKLELVEIPDSGGQKQPKDQEAFSKFQEEFLSTPCEVGNRFKLHVNEIVGYKLSAVDLMALAPILTGYDVLEEGAEDGKKDS